MSKKDQKDWGKVCKLDRDKLSTEERDECARLDSASFGAVDTFAVQGPPPPGTPYDFQKRGKAMGPSKSQMFTYTTKVHAPSWSVPAVGTCPSVCDIKKGKVRKSAPKKCLACYAFENAKYGTVDVQQATHRRYGWFDKTDEATVVKDLVKSIKVAGREVCQTRKATKNTPWTDVGEKKPKLVREDPTECDLDPSGRPTRFRIFDSGDFHDARAVRIWRKVAKQVPGTKFWAPTTAWIRKGDSAMMKELALLAKMKNVALKPSGLKLDTPAPAINIKGVPTAGTTVVSWKAEKHEVACPWTGKRTRKQCMRSMKVLPGAKTLKGGKVIYDPLDDTTLPKQILIKDVKHYLCKGDCAKCQRCWEKDAKVAYVQHGPDVKDRDKQAKRAKSQKKYVSLMYPQLLDRGPRGAMEHPATNFLVSKEFVTRLGTDRYKKAKSRAKKATEKERKDLLKKIRES